MSPPESIPRLLPFLYPEDEQADRIKDRPRAVCEIAVAIVNQSGPDALGWSLNSTYSMQ